MWQLVLTSVVVVAAAWTGERLGVPAGALLGGLLAAAALNFGGTEAASLPPAARTLAYAAVGWAIGQQITAKFLSTLSEALVPAAFTVVSLVVFGLIIGWALRFFGLDVPTGFLAASPGGLSQMAAISHAVEADAPLVTVIHTARVVAVMLLAPVVARMAP